MNREFQRNIQKTMHITTQDTPASQEHRILPPPQLEEKTKQTKQIVTKQYVKGLSSSEDPAAFSELVRLSQHPNNGIRMAVVEALGSRKEKESIGALINLLMKDKSWLIRRKAAEMLGLRGDPAGIPPLMMALQHDVRCHAREAAARALGRLKAKEAAAALRTAMESSDENEKVRAAARKALKELGENVGA